MPRPVGAKVNITRSVSVLLPLQGVSYAAHYTQGVASLALGYELLSLRDVPIGFLHLHRCVALRMRRIRAHPSRRRRIETRRGMRRKTNRSVKRPIRAHR